MVTKFSIFERLGYNDEVSNLAEYVWKKYKEGERTINLSEYTSKNMTIFVNNLYIVEYKNSDSNTRMSVTFNNKNYEKTKDFKIEINRGYRPTLMSMEHELKHKYKDIKNYIKYSRLKANLDYLNKNNLNLIIDKISVYDKQIIMKFYYDNLRKDKNMDLGNVKLKFEDFKSKFMKFLRNNFISDVYFTSQEIDKFYNFEKEIEKKKKVYQRYIERLYSYFS